MSKYYRLMLVSSVVILSLLACNLQTTLTPNTTPSPSEVLSTGTSATQQSTALPVASDTATITPTVFLPATGTALSSPTAICDQADFISETVPDGSAFGPGSSFTKTWRLKNTGVCTWTSGYALVFVSGNTLGAPAAVPLAGNVTPGQEVDLMVNMQAPAAPGSYTSNWELRNASGVLFGVGQGSSVFWAKITVLAPTSTATLASPGATFVHVASAGTIDGDYTIIDDPRTNNKPNLVLFITQNWNPGGSGNTYDRASVGVWYDGAVQKWSIFNEDQSAMPVNAAFNVWIPSSGATDFIQTATSTNSISDYTLIDDPRTNNQPNLMLMITQNWNPGGGVSGIYDRASVGVWYDTSANKWSIFNEDKSSMPVNAAFNILLAAPGVSSYLQSATASNTVSNYTEIDNSLTNNNPNVILFVTQNWDPGGVGNTYNPASIGVWYDGSAQKWSIFNEDKSTMPVNAAFNVFQAH